MRTNLIKISLFAFFLIFLSLGTTKGRTVYDPNYYKNNNQGFPASGAPAHGCAAHRVGQIELAINNNGTFGTGFTAGINQDYFTGDIVPSCDYPKNSGVQYLFAASFWIGAVVGRDTLVSFGAAGWHPDGRELLPDEGNFGKIVKRSIIDPTKPEYEGAISEEDYICVYTDTYTDGIAADIGSLRPHIPLHIEATEASYAWSYSYAEDFVLFDYKIRNIGSKKLEKVYMGIYVDADVCYDCESGYVDDICGFLHTRSAECYDCEYEDEVNIAWIADNDGDLRKTGSAPHVTATRIIRTPAEKLDVSFNWWISNMAPSKDFGPREQGGKGRLEEDFRDFGTGGLGTPEGDANKYYIMRNQEFDYDQAFTAAIQPTDTLWLDPGEQAAEFAYGYDTRYLLSFGPFEITPGDVLPISFAYVAGENFHQNPDNINNLPYDPDLFYANLNFDSLAYNAKWASWIYDNPGVDTDSDGFAGEIFVCVRESTLVDSSLIPGSDPPEYEYIFEAASSDTCFISGDGVPDFRGASPPPAPHIWVTPQIGALKIRFNGLRSETTKDIFSDLIDFEGYRVYLSRDERSSSYYILASYDLENYNKWIWNPDRNGGEGYELLEIPFSADSLNALYGVYFGENDFDPNFYNSPSRPFVHPDFSDSMFYFIPQDYNVSQLGVTTPINKPEEYRDVPYPSTLLPEEADPDELTPDGYFKYFEYEIVIENLLPTVPYWVNITAFDFGSPISGLPSLESSVTVGSVSAYPHTSADEVASENLKVFVYPNPFRIDGGYISSGFEGPVDEDNAEDRVHELHFVNVPAVCTIRIFSLDGDLVREIFHDVPASDPQSSHEVWDLITRNTQLVVSGLYFWVIEEENGETQIGKIAIIM